MKVVILCGGLGTRAYPYTRRVPKALMPVSGVPVLEQVMRIYASQGYDQFVLALGHMKTEIIRYARSRRHVYSIDCVDTGDTTDTGGRVRRCLDHVGDSFHCTYVDGLGDIDLGALVRFHVERGAGATLTAAALRSQYGILHADSEDRITEFVEKPVLPEYWINAGFFVFQRDVFAGVSGENLERDILPELARRRLLCVHRHTGFWRSMDTYKDQQELDALWTPHAQRIVSSLPRFDHSLPSWLAGRSRAAATESA